jgi:quinoprotein glucose dehydrogenase
VHRIPHAYREHDRSWRGRAIRLATAASLGLTVAACATGPRASVRTTSAAQKSYDFVGWDGYLGGGDSSQYSALNQINRGNVNQLQVAWTYQAGEGGPYRFNPIVVRGTMYLLAQNNALVALDPTTGQEKWRRPNEGRVGDRGINYWESKDGKDRRLFYVNNGMLRAISAETGEPIATFGKAGAIDLRDGLEGDTSKINPLQTSNPGRIFGNLLILPLPAGAYDFASSPADVHAYDVRTGKLVWVFHVVPRPGEYGSETWPEGNRGQYGGVHNWSEATIDEQSGIVYIPTGTARYDFYGGNRPGNNLFANSLLALDARTGKRIWHYQTIHHDLWDWDLPQAPKLLTITKDGKQIPVVIQAAKHGFLFVFDRRNGEPIWPIEERPVPASDVPGEKASPTQPFPTWPKPFTRQAFTEADINPYLSDADKAKVREMFKTVRNEGLFTPPSVQGTISMPGHNGGANWGTSAVDPVHQRLFVMAKQLPTLDKLILDKRESAQAAMPNGGGDVKPYKSPVNFLVQSNSLSAIGPPWSTITAYDMNSGNILWQLPNGEVSMLEKQGITGTGSHAPRGGPVATAGGLLFVGTSSDRKFRARDADTGKVIWEFDLPAATEGVPAVYEVGGRQYVVIAVGGEGLFSNGFGAPKPGPNQYIAFALPAGAQAAGAK